MGEVGTESRKGEQRNQSQMTGRDGPGSTLEVQTVTVSRWGSRKGDSQREGNDEEGEERESKIERGYSPDTSLVRGVGTLQMGRWFEPQKCGRVYNIADRSQSAELDQGGQVYS